MARVTLSPSYELTTDHPASSYGQPVLVYRSSGEAYGRDDILKPYGGWGFMPAWKAVERLGRIGQRTEAELEFIARFVNFGPGA